MTRQTDIDPGGRSAGFTLVELMVSLAIMALIAVIASNALVSGQMVWTHINEGTANAEKVAAIQNMMRQQIQQALPLTGRTNPREERLLMIGSKESLSYVAPLPSHFGRFGLYRIEYRLMDGKLIFARTPFQGTNDFQRSFSDMTHETLIDGVKSLNFSYLRTDRNHHGWSQTLMDPTDMPNLIRIDVEFEDSSVRWQPIYVRPQITALN